MNQIEEALLRRPFLELPAALYKDNAILPGGSKHDDPTPSHNSNQVTIQQILLESNRGPPTDEDVVRYFTDLFLRIYLVHGVALDNETRAQDVMDEGIIPIAHALIQLWEQTVEYKLLCDRTLLTVGLLQTFKAGPVSLSSLKFMFISTLLQEVAYNILVWYAKGPCGNPNLEKEGGNYVEKQLWGGISEAEFVNYTPVNIMLLEDVGITKDGAFFPIGKGALLFSSHCELTLYPKSRRDAGRTSFEARRIQRSSAVGHINPLPCTSPVS
jgi:hypothetical protein